MAAVPCGASAAAEEVTAPSGASAAFAAVASCGSSPAASRKVAPTVADCERMACVGVGNTPASSSSASAPMPGAPPAQPIVPGEYFRFAGKVVIVDAASPDHADGARAFTEAFSRRRFEEAFPEAAAAGLPRLVGLDMEWRPDKSLFSDNPIALVQVACWDTAFLVRTVGCRELPPWLRELLEDDDVVKVTASFDVADKAKLKRSFGWEVELQAKATSFLDMADLAKEREVPHAMHKMAHFFNTPMLKRKTVGCSDWATEEALTPDQCDYAADDAFFTLYLAGLVLLHKPPAADDLATSKAFQAWQILRPAMDASMKSVDNSEYQSHFLELREIVKEAVRSLSNMLGAGGSTTMNSIQSVKAVQKAVSVAQKKCTLQLGLHFLKLNCDIFHVFFENGEFRVKLRSPDGAAAEEAARAAAEEDDDAFVVRVMETLASYKPPIGKRETTTNHHVPEPAWVPARAILSDAELTRFEMHLSRAANNNASDGGSSASSTHASGSLADSVESSYCEPDGLLLRLLKHPRAVDPEVHLKRCVAMLEEGGLSAKEASTRLLSDAKFAQLSKSLKLVGSDSPEESQIFRSLRARAKMLVDSHALSVQVSTTWHAVHDALEKSKRYRKTLGTWLASFDKASDADGGLARSQPIRDFLAAAVVAWPDIDRCDPSTNGGASPQKGQTARRAAAAAPPAANSSAGQKRSVETADGEASSPKAKRTRVGFSGTDKQDG
eukprot:TRINITY_DN28698_c0_g1_i1.p1 TRINITY_DN28698_c0_g1~~TRINITY_DN28698_c0_g1_i1.p1  ORF type:complete len:724 (+),score=168.92 TRINITY_DN28698_c0_g1_i1:115-2286(+)